MKKGLSGRRGFDQERTTRTRVSGDRGRKTNRGVCVFFVSVLFSFSDTILTT